MLEDGDEAVAPPQPHKMNGVACEGAKNLNFPSFTV
jgi:hypothetical protein